MLRRRIQILNEKKVQSVLVCLGISSNDVISSTKIMLAPPSGEIITTTRIDSMKNHATNHNYVGGYSYYFRFSNVSVSNSVAYNCIRCPRCPVLSIVADVIDGNNSTTAIQEQQLKNCRSKTVAQKL